MYQVNVVLKQSLHSFVDILSRYTLYRHIGCNRVKQCYFSKYPP